MSSSSSSRTTTMKYDDIRASIDDVRNNTSDFSRVEVNQRALIDKILARYATAGAVYRELIQNSNDAEATTAEILFTTTTTNNNNNSDDDGINGRRTTGTTEQHSNNNNNSNVDATTTTTSSSNSNSNIVRQVVYRNNGMPFRKQDWTRLKKIAEGNPNPTKVGAFGVGAYSMFSICDEPLVVSGNEALAFIWRGDSLWTKTISNYHHDGNDGSSSNGKDNNNNNQQQQQQPKSNENNRDDDSSSSSSSKHYPWTSFVLPSRDPYPVPDMIEFGEFLCASLTFTKCLRHVTVYVDNKERLTIIKTLAEEPRLIQIPKAALTTATDTSSSNSFTSWWSSTVTKDAAITASPRGIFYLEKAKNKNNNNSSWSGINSNTTGTVVDQNIYESVHRITVMLDDDISSIDARYVSVTAKTKIPPDMSKRMERVTKKLPPEEVPIQIFMNANVLSNNNNNIQQDDGSNSINNKKRNNNNNSKKDKKKKSTTPAQQITNSFIPKHGCGRIFIGFRTSQTTGLGIHVVAPFIPTVEREAIDIQDPTLAIYNTELLDFTGIIMRLTLEHTMYNVINTTYKQNYLLKYKKVDEQLRLEHENNNNKSSSSSNSDARGGGGEDDSDNNNDDNEENNDDDDDNTSSSSVAAGGGFMGFARFMARGVRKQISSVVHTVQERILVDDNAIYFNPPDPRPLSVEEEQAIVLMQSFCPEQSTPDATIGTIIAQGFTRCLPNIIPPILTTTGVVSGNIGRLPNLGIEAFVHEHVVRSVVYKNTETYHNVIVRCTKLNIEILLQNMMQQQQQQTPPVVFEEHRMIHLIKWFTKYSRIEPMQSRQYSRQLKELIKFYPASIEIGNASGGNSSSSSNNKKGTIVTTTTNNNNNNNNSSNNNANNRTIVALDSYVFYADEKDSFLNTGTSSNIIMPLPESVLPKRLMDKIGKTTLSDPSLIDWFTPLPIEIWAEYIVQHKSITMASAKDEPLRIEILLCLYREYVRRSVVERPIFGSFVKSLLVNKPCMPYDDYNKTMQQQQQQQQLTTAPQTKEQQQPKQQELAAAMLPGELYLYSAELKAFEGVGSFYKVSNKVKDIGITEDFLTILGVRKSVSVDFLFANLDKLKWSNDPKYLIEYLRTSQLTQNDITKLAGTQYLPASNDKTRLFAPSELYLPNNSLSIFPFVKTMQWPSETEVSDRSANGKFLTRLGMRIMPTLHMVLSYASQNNLEEKERLQVLDFISNRLGPHGIYHNEYVRMPYTKKSQYCFLPAIRHDPFIDYDNNNHNNNSTNKAIKSHILSPTSCFSDKSCAIMGFPILDPKLGDNNTKLYGSLFHCPQQPDAQLLLTQLLDLVSVAVNKQRTVMNPNGVDEKLKKETLLCIEKTFVAIFDYLSHRTSDIGRSNLASLSNHNFIPCKEEEDDKNNNNNDGTSFNIVWCRPDQVFFRRRNNNSDNKTSNDTLTEELFKVVEFSPFLAAAGVKEEATTADLFQLMLSNPKNVLQTLGGEKKYRALLRRIAANRPFSRVTIEMKRIPFLLAYKLKSNNDNSEKEKSEDDDDDEGLTFELARANEIYIIDNSFFGRMFPVKRSPPESDLEDFYALFGSRYISESVQRRFEAIGRPRTETPLTEALKERLLERGPLLVSPNITSRPLVRGAALILSEKRLQFFQADNLMAVYSLDGQQRRNRTTCFSREINNSKRVVYVVDDFDWFDVGYAIGDMILTRCQLEDAFFISSLLEAPLQQLRARGFPVDRILRPPEPVAPPPPPAKQVSAPPPPQPTIASTHQRDTTTTAAAASATPATSGSNPTPSAGVGTNSAVEVKQPKIVAKPEPTTAASSAADTSVRGGPPPQKPTMKDRNDDDDDSDDDDDGDGKQPSKDAKGTAATTPTGKPADDFAQILQQMFPDADPDTIKAYLGPNPSLDDVRQIAETLAATSKPPQKGGDAGSVATEASNGTSETSTDMEEPKKKSSSKGGLIRKKIGKALGGLRGSGSTSAPPSAPAVPPTAAAAAGGGGGVGAPPSSGAANETREPVSPANDAHTQQRLEQMLEHTVTASAKVNKSGIEAPDVKLTSAPKELDRGETCEILPGHSLKPFPGPRGDGKTHNGIVVFSSRKEASSEIFLNNNQNALDAFSIVLENLAKHVYGLQMSNMAIYHDPSGTSIAFNSNRALHFNVRFFYALHYTQGKQLSQECYSYWYVTIAHELAHHVVSGHTKEHGFYTESYVTHYLPKLLSLLSKL